MKTNKYSYLQGYHDVILTLLLIFIDKTDNFVLSICQRFSEIFYFDYLKFLDNQNKENKDLTFVNKIIISIIKKYNSDIYNFFMEISKGDIGFAFPWIINYFGNLYENVIFQLRHLDYFVCSHPLSIFYLASNIIIEEFSKWKKTENERKVRIYLIL